MKKLDLHEMEVIEAGGCKTRAGITAGLMVAAFLLAPVTAGGTLALFGASVGFGFIAGNSCYDAIHG